MSGILFLKSNNLTAMKEFYAGRIGSDIWLEQADCIIFRHGNFLFGFCLRDSVDTEVLLTFFFDKKEMVDEFHEKLKDRAESRPVENEKYDIYQFFASDPEGRRLEFQYFNNPVSQHLTGDCLLTGRRSQRKFLNTEVTSDILEKVFELCRFAPTSCNSQSYYFKVINDKNIQQKLSEIRGASSSPIRNSPTAVAICCDPTATKRVEQDGCIAAYHFILAAWHFGLGTCWIAAMNRSEVKKMLDIPDDHYVATVTPLGYPVSTTVKTPTRHPKEHFIR